MEITIKDIAADAKVSVSTVSRVMNGSKAVSDELRHRVMRSIEKYHYIPNAEARSLVTKNTHLGGFGGGLEKPDHRDPFETDQRCLHET